ncbi:MAG: hypothetical protein JWP97_5765 [Labilithrix sp.]|nr:hypothetical protein [Labilithrix sp.]
MTLPRLTYGRSDGNTGSARSAPIGIFAIIAACSAGVAAKPTSTTSKDQAVASFGTGELPEFAAYMIPVADKPVVLVKATATTLGSYGALTTTGAPGSTPSAITAGATKPVDRFRVVVRFPVGGTIGTAGITWQFSLDNGKTWSAVSALGTATSIVLTDTGITLLLGAGGILAGETVAFTTRGPVLSLADITSCLDALKATGLSFEAILIGSVDADATMINGVRTALAGFMSRGLSKRAILNVRAYTPGTETAQAYIDALTVISTAGRVGTRVDVCADGCYIPSPIRGISMWRPTALALAARIAKISLGTDAAYVADGPVDSATIFDDDGSTICWDEAVTPGLDDQGFVTLRTLARRAGCFVGNPRVFSPIGSDYVFDQQERTMCVAEERTYDFLTEELSAKKRKEPVPGPQGQVYMLEADLADIEQRATLDVQAVLRGEVTDVRVSLARTDDVGANSGAVITATVEISSLIYIKGFAVTTRFVRSFTI